MKLPGFAELTASGEESHFIKQQNPNCSERDPAGLGDISWQVMAEEERRIIPHLLN